MNPHVHIDADIMGDRVRVWLVERPAVPGGPAYVIRKDTREAVEPGTDKGEPSLILDDQMGRALLDALAKHYDHTPDTTIVGKALQREQARTDKLLDALITCLIEPTIVDYAGTTTPQTVSTGRAARPSSLLPDSSRTQRLYTDVTDDGRGTGIWSGRAGG